MSQMPGPDYSRINTKTPEDYSSMSLQEYIRVLGLKVRSHGEISVRGFHGGGF